ncbi:MAG: FkbM family methyltransferase [Lachnospiraceae bacterium]
MLKELFNINKEKYGVGNEIVMLNYFIDHKILKYIVYGSDADCEYIIDFVKSVYNVLPDFIVDENPTRTSVCGISVIPFSAFEKLEPEKYFVIVAKENYETNKMFVAEKLHKNGAVILLNAHRIMKGVWSDWYKYIKDNIDKFQLLYDKLQDDISKDTLYHYLKTYITGKRYEGRTFPLEYKYWGIDDTNDKLFELKEDEVILNLGGFCGDTIYLFLKNNLSFKKIISVEANDENYSYLSRNVGLLEKEDRERVRLEHCYVGIGNNTIDNLYKDEGISLIEMDIEGAELDVLMTGIEVIKKQRPILAICAYHKKDDLIVLPKFVNDNLDNYTIKLRKYPSELFLGLPGIQQINELVMYAIPNERLIQYDNKR